MSSENEYSKITIVKFYLIAIAILVVSRVVPAVLGFGACYFFALVIAQMDLIKPFMDTFIMLLLWLPIFGLIYCPLCECLENVCGRIFENYYGTGKGKNVLTVGKS